MSAAVDVRRVPAPAIGADTVLVVSEALLALVAWRDVPVVRVVREELTRLERFLLEAALALGTVDAATLEELVSLPRGVLAGGMSRLVAGGAVQLFGDTFHVVAEVAAGFLKQEAVVREVPATMDFALLPRTGDLLAVDPRAGATWLRQLERDKLAPAAKAPVPHGLWGEQRGAYLARRVREGITGAPAGLLAVLVPDDDVPLLSTGIGASERHEGVCSAYRCEATVRREPAGTLVVSARLRGRRMRRLRSDEDGEDAVGTIAVDLSTATNLVASWLGLADALAQPAVGRDAWARIGPRAARDVHHAPPSEARRVGTSAWELSLPGSTARAIADEGRAVTEPVGLEVRGEEAVVELSCTFAAADAEARTLFARDAAAARLQGSAAPADDLDGVCRAAQIAPESLRERIWTLRLYRLAYALREREDFVHD